MTNKLSKILGTNLVTATTFSDPCRPFQHPTCFCQRGHILLGRWNCENCKNHNSQLKADRTLSTIRTPPWIRNRSQVENVLRWNHRVLDTTYPNSGTLSRDRMERRAPCLELNGRGQPFEGAFNVYYVGNPRKKPLLHKNPLGRWYCGTLMSMSGGRHLEGLSTTGNPNL